MPAPWTAIVLAGGRSSRLGTDKIQARLDDRRVIDHVLATLPDGVPVVVVGPDPEAVGRDYRVTRETEPGSGPVAAIAAGLTLTSTPLVAVLAADMPFAGSLLPSLIDELATSPSHIDAVIPTDPHGREQPLCAAYRTRGLARELSNLGSPEGRSVRDLRAGLTVTLHLIGSSDQLLDVDTADDLEVARRSVPSDRGEESTTRRGESMDEWVAAVSTALGIDQAVDLDTILDVARDAAHAVARPAAPVTTFLLGVAVANGADANEAAATIAALAKSWPSEQSS